MKFDEITTGVGNNFSCIYCWTNLINGKKYIGKRSCKCPIEEDKYIGILAKHNVFMIECQDTEVGILTRT